MRFVLAMVLAGLVALPVGANAQGAEEDSLSSWQQTEATPEEPSLELKLDEAGVEVAPMPPRTPEGYTLEEMDVRVRRAKIGLGSSAAAFFVGGILLASGLSGDCFWGSAEREKCDRRAYAGTALAAGGAPGLIAAGALLGVRKRELRRMKEAHYGTPRRVQWDLARSRLVF